jgi:hypothetical protein
MKGSYDQRAVRFIVTINTRDSSIGLFNWSIPYLIDHSHVLRLLLFNWLISIEFIIRCKGASSPLTACSPSLTSPLIFYYFTLFKSFLLHSSTIIISINRNCLSVIPILIFSFSNARTKKIRGTASRYLALNIPLNFYKWLDFCESLLSSLTKCICNFRQSSMINRKSYSV